MRDPQQSRGGAGASPLGLGGGKQHRGVWPWPRDLQREGEMLVVPSKRAAGSGMCLGAAGGHLLGGTGLAPGVGTSSVAQGWFLVVAPPRWWHRAGSWCHLLGGTGLAPGVIRAQGCWWWHTALWGAPDHGTRCLVSGLAPMEKEKHQWGLHHQLTWIVFCFNSVALIPRCGHKCLQTRPWDGMASSAPGAS